MADVQVTFLMDEFMVDADRSKEQFFHDLLGQIDAAFYPEVLAQTPWDETERFKESPHEHIKKLWRSNIDDASLSVTFGNDAPYATVLDLGHYPGVGPRTIEGEGGIYSRRAPSGILKPIMNKDVLKRLVDQALKSVKMVWGKGK